MKNWEVEMETERGTIIIQTNTDKASKTSAHFLDLVEDGFYDGTVFCRIPRRYRVDDVRLNVPPEYRDLYSDEDVKRIAALYKVKVLDRFVVQGGVPEGETNDYKHGDPIILERTALGLHVPGAVGMARDKEPDTADCQFYIVTNTLDTVKDPSSGSALPHLDGRYAVFGRVVSHLGLLYEIEEGDLIVKARIF